MVSALMTIDFSGFERLENAPYSPDLAPMESAIFSRLRSDIHGCHFATQQNLQTRIPPKAMLLHTYLQCR